MEGRFVIVEEVPVESFERIEARDAGAFELPETRFGARIYMFLEYH